MTTFDRIDILCARRIQDGTRKYGCLDLANDQRDFAVEAQEEALDGINYTRWAMARKEISSVVGNVVIYLFKAAYTLLIGI